MAQSKNTNTFAQSHLVRYDELIPCTTAFIDTRTPGSQEKENFTIIGPGVAENPDQHVHITRPHGFNIGGARQPPNCVNSQHSHDTAEVFIVYSGTWSFNAGEHGDDSQIILHTGDAISIPTHCFRGFENVGDDVGFLFAVLGGDDPGRVTWAPYVFEQAQSHGLVLLENGSLVDTAAGETVPNHVAPMPITDAATIAELQTLSVADLEACTVLKSQIEQAPKITRDGDQGVIERHLLGNAYDSNSAPPLNWAHGFQIHHLELSPQAKTERYCQQQEEVFLVESGSMIIEVADQVITLNGGDVFTAPIGEPRQLSNPHNSPCVACVVHGGESPVRAPAH